MGTLHIYRCTRLIYGEFFYCAMHNRLTNAGSNVRIRYFKNWNEKDAYIILVNQSINILQVYAKLNQVINIGKYFNNLQSNEEKSNCIPAPANRNILLC